MELKDYYSLLGISANSSLSEIKSAYRKLSKKLHPDMNNGDKFFEEKFKQIQEAYEVLTDGAKRKEFDNKRKSGNKNYNSNDDYLRKKEQEFKKQQEDFKKWEDTLKQKEDELNNRDSTKHSQKFPFIIFKIAFALLAIYLFYSLILNLRYETPVLQNVQTPNTIQTTEILDIPPVELVNSAIFTKFKRSRIATILDGEWIGLAEQYDINDSWKIKFSCNIEKGELFIEYPGLNCGGKLVVENFNDHEVVFREIISYGTGGCINEGKVILKKINNNRFDYLYYSPASTKINAKGKITK